MSSDPISKYDSHGFNFCSKIYHDTYPFISPISPDNLKGRHVLVTGAARGIGRAIALSVARAGASGIIIMDRTPVEDVAHELVPTAEREGHPAPRVVAQVADVTSAEQVSAVGEAIKAAYGGKLDAIVLNAGVLEPITRIAEQDPIKWWKSYEVIVLGVFLCLRTFIPLLRSTKEGLGTVVGVNSQSAMLLRPGFSGMASAKLAQSKLLDFVNAEYGQVEDESMTPLIAYWVHPGAVAHPERTDLPEALQSVCVDTPQLPADTISWLIREKRQWLAGRFIRCDWE